MSPEAAQWIAGSVAALVAVAAVAAWWWRRRARDSVECVVRRLAARRLRDVFLPDGLGGLIHFDHILLTRSGFLVLDLRRYPGAIFCGARIERWTQVVSSGAYGFPNPIDGLNARMQSLRALEPRIPVHGRVVFTRESHFPRGCPAFVSRVDSLAEDVAEAEASGEIPAAYLEAWARVEALARRAGRSGGGPGGDGAASTREA